MNMDITCEEYQAQLLAERGHQDGALRGWTAEPRDMRFHRMVDEGIHLYVRRIWLGNQWQWITGTPGSRLFPEMTCPGPRQGMRRIEQDAAKLIRRRSPGDNLYMSLEDRSHFLYDVVVK